MKYIFLYSLIVFNLIFSAPIEISLANKVAININKQFNQNTNKASVTVKNIETINTDYQPLIYVYHLNPVGFILISADNKALPYLGYSFDSNFKTKNMPSNISYVLETYKSHIISLINSDEPRNDEIISLWDEFSDSNFHQTQTRDVSPLIDAEFDQSGAWNNALAEFGFYGPVGCVAVSMSQLMHYWSFPEQGEGSNSYVDDNLGTLSVDFSLANYDFNNMAATYATAASQLLLYHTGVSVNMDYDNSGSGAMVEGVYPSAEYAMQTYFKYSEDIYNVYKENYTDSEFRNIIINELNNNRPVLYSGYESSNYDGGHAWNIDGFQNNNFHCNWGWGGWNNGYFNITSMGGFSYYQNFLLNIIPEPYTSPMALFEYDVSDYTVTFIDLSEVINETVIETWNWDFGDGTAESYPYGVAENTYSSAGEYLVELTVTNIYGQTGLPHTETIIIGSLLLGDINFDSILNVLDIVMLVNFVLDNSNPTNSEFNAADMNGDNILNILDIVSLVNTILNS